MSSNCEFCDKDSFVRQIVYESETFHVLLPRKPKSDGHLMIVSKHHIHRMDELDSRTASDYIKTVRRIYKRTKKEEKENFSGYNTLSNNGSVEIGQHIQHFHMHMFLRFKDESCSPFDVLSGRDECHSYSHEEYNNLIEQLRARFL